MNILQRSQTLWTIKLAEFSPYNFKCSIFVQGLVLTKYAEIRGRVLNKLENEPNLTLQNLAEDCQRFINVRQDTKDIEASDLSHINKYVKKIKGRKNITPNPCYAYGKLDFYNDCPYKNKECFRCKKQINKTKTKTKENKEGIRKLTITLMITCVNLPLGI